MSKFTYTTRKDGRLVKKVTINGKVKYLYSDDSKDLEKQYIEAMYQKNTNTYSPNCSISFERYSKNWFELNISNKELATQKSVQNRINHMNKYFGKMNISSIRPNDIQLMVTDMEKLGYKDVTNRTLQECKRIFESAVVNDIIQKNPAKSIKRIKYQRSERIPLTIDEDKKVVNFALTHKYGLFILILRYCGLRPEECVALTLDDVNFANKSLNVNKAVSLALNQPVVKETKTKKNRIVPIPNFIIPILNKHVAHQREIGSQFIFTKEKDNLSMWSKTTLKVHLNSFLNDLNKDSSSHIHFTYYQLRHSYCTMLYYAGIKPKEAQRLMGHSSIKMVYDIYTHLDEERENSMQTINNYISSNILTTF